MVVVGVLGLVVVGVVVVVVVVAVVVVVQSIAVCNCGWCLFSATSSRQCSSYVT